MVEETGRLIHDFYARSVSLDDNNKVGLGIKDDSAKPRTDLLDPDFLLGVSQVLGKGAEKYADHNWRRGLTYGRVLGAILRHTLAILKGEDIDPEWGLPHTAHLGCEVMFLHWMMLNRKDMDDRWSAQTK